MQLSMTKERDPKRSRSSLNYIERLISRKGLFTLYTRDIMQLNMTKERDKSVNSFTFTYLCSPISCNKTANIIVKIPPFTHVLTTSCIDWRIENSKKI